MSLTVMLERVECNTCHHLLLNMIAELPFEIPSTGAIMLKIDAEIKCDKCKNVDIYTMLPKNYIDTK
jgi:hypothetical protein